MVILFVYWRWWVYYPFLYLFGFITKSGERELLFMWVIYNFVISIPSRYQVGIKALDLRPCLFVGVVCKNSRGMKWEGKSNNSMNVLNNMWIEMMTMMMRITLKLAPLAIIKRMLILSIVDHTVIVLLLNIKGKGTDDLIKILTWELIFLNSRGKYNLMISLIGFKLLKGFFFSKSILMLEKWS